MKRQLFAVIACAAAVCAAGPRTTPEEFFTKHLDTSIPALSSIPAKMAAGDLAGAEKVFADHVRATLRNDALNKDWLERKYEGKALRAIKRRAGEIMDYRLSSCGMPHHFTDHKVDWDLNPTFNKYKEWTWQLSRHPFWTTLAEYYTATGDEKAVTVWIDMISSWFDQALVPEKAHDLQLVRPGARAGEGRSRRHALLAHDRGGHPHERLEPPDRGLREVAAGDGRFSHALLHLHLGARMAPAQQLHARQLAPHGAARTPAHHAPLPVPERRARMEGVRAEAARRGVLAAGLSRRLPVRARHRLPRRGDLQLPGRVRALRAAWPGEARVHPKGP